MVLDGDRFLLFSFICCVRVAPSDERSAKMERYKLICKKLGSFPIAAAAVVASLLKVLEEVSGRITEGDDIVEDELEGSTTAVDALFE